MKKLYTLLILVFLLLGCKVQSMYDSELENPNYPQDPGMIYYNYYSPNYDPYDRYYYPNGTYDRSRINMDYEMGVRFTHKNRKHPDFKPNYQPQNQHRSSKSEKPKQFKDPDYNKLRQNNRNNGTDYNKMIKPPNNNNLKQYSSPQNKSNPTRQQQSSPTKSGSYRQTPSSTK